MGEIENLKFDEDGLLPAIAQDCFDGTVLMLAYLSEEALQKTLQTGEAHYWSRSRKKLWRKGETSGNIQRVRRIKYDCDKDALLLEVEQLGPACHTGERSCFFNELQIGHRAESGPEKQVEGEKGRAELYDMFQRIYEVILDRKVRRQKGSYVCSLFEAGMEEILKKIAEESCELIIASKNGDRLEIVREAADLWFHTLVLLGFHGIAPDEVGGELASRFGKRHTGENRD